ncbi:MAG TPA: T9SS type A sorting domain-containing protein [Candidatus Krumholzibacteriaceae bacterium]|nr:T9SS type A sorting domain-containing protein [Candidatus Krumholzibacteriaceae bacterium]
MNKFINILKVLFVIFLIPSFANTTVWSEDPFTGGTSVTKAFMELDDISPQNLHTGIDIKGSDDVYAPIPDGTTAKIHTFGSDYIVLLGAERQFGDYAVCQLLHVTPESDLTAGTWINNSKLLGSVSGGHLHFEVFLSNDTNVNDADLRSPRRYALENAGSWNDDTTAPEITDDTVLVPDPPVQYTETIFKIHAADLDSDYYHGIAGMELLIDDNVVDSFDFNGKLSKSGTYPPDKSEYYACTTSDCIPSGTNNPNVLTYKLKWTPQDTEEHVWRVRWWDAMGNTAEGDPADPPAIKPIPSKSNIKAYPNPSSTDFSFQITTPKNQNITFEIYDVLGRKVKALPNKRFIKGLNNTISWDGTNSRGERVASGIYFLKAMNISYFKTHKITVIK